MAVLDLTTGLKFSPKILDFLMDEKHGSHDRSTQMAQKTMSRGLEGLQLEVRPPEWPLDLEYDMTHTPRLLIYHNLYLKVCLLTPFLWWARLSYYKLFVNSKVVHPKILGCLVMVRMMRIMMIMVMTMKIDMMIMLMVVMMVIDDDWLGALCQLDDWQTIEALLWVLAPLLVPSQSLSW